MNFKNEPINETHWFMKKKQYEKFSEDFPFLGTPLKPNSQKVCFCNTLIDLQNLHFNADGNGSPE